MHTLDERDTTTLIVHLKISVSDIINRKRKYLQFSNRKLDRRRIISSSFSHECANLKQ